jgi:holin-like protein
MKTLQGFAWLLVLQSAGEALARLLSLPFPGPVVGMVLLLVALRWSLVRDSVAAVAEFLLTHLSLLFVPVGVGVMTHLGLLSQYGLRLAVVIVLSTWVGLGVTALVLRALVRRDGPGADTHAKAIDGNAG